MILFSAIGHPRRLQVRSIQTRRHREWKDDHGRESSRYAPGTRSGGRCAAQEIGNGMSCEGLDCSLHVIAVDEASVSGE